MDLECYTAPQLEEVQHEIKISHLVHHQNIACYLSSFVVGTNLWAVQPLMHYGEERLCVCKYVQCICDYPPCPVSVQCICDYPTCPVSVQCICDYPPCPVSVQCICDYPPVLRVCSVYMIIPPVL